jgi:hypothetical protein
MSCSMELVEMLDKIDLEKKEKEEEELNKVKCENIYLKCMMKNMILSLVSTENFNFEWEIKRDYGMNYHDDYIRYKNRTLRELCEEMSETDFNEDGERSALEFDDNIIFYYFNDSEDETTDSEVFSDEE